MGDEAEGFRVAFVDGVTVSEWARVWSDRVPEVGLELTRVDDAAQVTVLHDGLVDMAFVRLPVDDEALSVIPLYTEEAFVVVAKDHPVAMVDAVTLQDLSDEERIDGSDDDAVALAAAGAGVLIVPQSIARLRSRRDVVSRPVTDAPGTRIGLAWLASEESDRIEEFIGIVRGRTARSSRGSTPAVERPEPATAVPTPRRSTSKRAAARRPARGRPRRTGR